MSARTKEAFATFVQRVNDLSEIEVAWLAGLLEGEGSFFISNSVSQGKRYPLPRIAVCMTDEDVILKVCALFQTKCSHVPIPTYGNLPQFRAGVSGRSAIVFMTRLLPYMGSRRSTKIASILEQYSQYPDPNERRRAWSKEAVKLRERNEHGQLT